MSRTWMLYNASTVLLANEVKPMLSFHTERTVLCFTSFVKVRLPSDICVMMIPTGPTRVKVSNILTYRLHFDFLRRRKQLGKLKMTLINSLIQYNNPTKQKC